MASKLKKKGASNSLQHFSEEKLVKWREELQLAARGVAIYVVDVILLYLTLLLKCAGSCTADDQNINVEEILEEVFQAHNQQEQLKAMKKVIFTQPYTVFVQYS